MVPKILHFVWIGGEFPSWVLNNIESVAILHTDWTIRVHGEDALDSRYSSIYDRAKDVQTRSDLIRYSVLEAIGGVYLDTDVYGVKRLPDFDPGERLAIPGIASPQFNTILACEAGCSIFSAAIEEMGQLDPASPMIGMTGLYREWQKNPASFDLLGLARWTAGTEADQYQYARIQEGLKPYNLPPEQLIIHGWRGGRS
jgi:hypothetical protein